MGEWRCIDRIKVRNGIITDYILKDDYTGNVEEVDAGALKRYMREGKVKVTNLKLLSDNRIIMIEPPKTKIGRTVQSTKINWWDSYLKDGDELSRGKINFVQKKLSDVNTSNKAKRLMHTALMIGLCSATIATSGRVFTDYYKQANGLTDDKQIEAYADTSSSIKNLDNTNVDDILTPVMTEETYETHHITEETYKNHNITTYNNVEQSIDDKINSAKEIYCDVQLLESAVLRESIKVEIDGEYIGDMKGKICYIFNNIKFTDTDGNKLASSGEKISLTPQDWCICDENDNVIYRLDQKLSFICDRYKIKDAEGNEVGYLKQKITLTKRSLAVLYDNEGNEIMRVTRDLLRKDFKIKFSDDCKLNKKALMLIGTNFILNTESSHNNNNSNRSNNN